MKEKKDFLIGTLEKQKTLSVNIHIWGQIMYNSIVNKNLFVGQLGEQKMVQDFILQNIF